MLVAQSLLSYISAVESYILISGSKMNWETFLLYRYRYSHLTKTETHTCEKIKSLCISCFVLLASFSSTLNAISPIRKPSTYLSSQQVFARKSDKLSGIKPKNCSSYQLQPPLTRRHCKNDDDDAQRNPNATAVTIWCMSLTMSLNFQSSLMLQALLLFHWTHE